jgi:membrane-associated phospholipid phosphatase
MPENILEWGILIILSLQGLGDWHILPMNALTFLGNAEFYLLIMPAIYWCWDSRLGLRIAVLFLLSTSLNLILKLIVQDPRPYWADPQVRLLTEPENSFGIPSGHAQNAVVTWGIMAAYLSRRRAWVAAIPLVFLIGLSRMYLGVHYPTDVLAGWVLGVIGLILFLRLEKPTAARFNQLSFWGRVVVVFVISWVIIITGLLASSAGASWQPPAEWLENAAAQTPDQLLTPFSLEDLISSASVFFGMIIGAIWLNTRYVFKPTGSWPQRLGRYLVGAVGVLILWQGLGAVFELLAADETLASYLLRYIRYSLIGGWVSAFGPLLFRRLGLAERVEM